MKKYLQLFIGLLIVLAGIFCGCVSESNQVDVADVSAYINPFLWRVEGENPSYLFGSIHVPDDRVLKLPDIVMNAIEDLQGLGVPTGALPDGSPNMMLQYGKALLCGAEKENSENGKVSASVFPTGPGSFKVFGKSV